MISTHNKSQTTRNQLIANNKRHAINAQQAPNDMQLTHQQTNQKKKNDKQSTHIKQQTVRNQLPRATGKAVDGAF